MYSFLALWVCLLSTASMLAECSGHFRSIQKRDPNFDVLHGANFPDPSVIVDNGRTYVFGTNDGNGHVVPFTENTNFDDPSGWSQPSDAFPPASVPAFTSWALSNSLWAPDVNKLSDGDGSYAMYYAAGLDSNPAVHCLGVARSLRIEGPYNDSSSQPWICPEEAGGAIDASGFLDDDNRRYVVYKIDGPAATNGGYCANSNNKPSNTSLMLVETTNNGYDRVSGPINLYNHDGLPDRYNIEAPSLIKSQEGIYFLFFSHGCYTDNSYGTSYVTSTNIQGPYGDRNLLIQTGDYGYYAPGGADVTLEAPWQMVFHSSKSSGTIANGRVLNTATLRLVGRTATIV